MGRAEIWPRSGSKKKAHLNSKSDNNFLLALKDICTLFLTAWPLHAAAGKWARLPTAPINSGRQPLPEEPHPLNLRSPDYVSPVR
jgi:hypothetical protein